MIYLQCSWISISEPSEPTETDLRHRPNTGDFAYLLFTVGIIGTGLFQALYYTAVLNGIVAPLLPVMIILVGNNHTIMKKKVNGRVSNTLGWITTIASCFAGYPPTRLLT